jgi:hypothetical protein
MAAVRFEVIEQDGQSIVREIHKIVVHRFRVGDTEDPDIYAAEPILDWERGEAGKFIMEHAIGQPEWHRQLDHMTYGYRYIITAELEAKKLSEYYLRWGNDGNNKV